RLAPAPGHGVGKRAWRVVPWSVRRSRPELLAPPLRRGDRGGEGLADLVLLQMADGCLGGAAGAGDLAAELLRRVGAGRQHLGGADGGLYRELPGLVGREPQ